MDKFIRELEVGDIHIRDRWQFELKSEFFASKEKKDQYYLQEFYIFIPNSLNINIDTYKKESFYSDQTNFVRYKTPIFSFDQINDEKNKRSPLYRIKTLLSDEESLEKNIEDEIKLLGNIVRSLIREKVLNLIKKIKIEDLRDELDKLKYQIDKFLSKYDDIIHHVKKEENKYSKDLIKHFYYVNEFIRNSIYYYFTGFLNYLRNNDKIIDQETDNKICKIILDQAPYIGSVIENMDQSFENSKNNEFIFYRAGLLNKFVLDALLLNINRSSPDTRLNNFIGSIAAGIAMLVYVVLLFVWQGTILFINTTTFILATVILYILKDRLKEGLKVISSKFAFRLFPDFTSKINTEEGDCIGILKESFFFLNREKLPQEIVTARNRKFHDILEDLKRPESIIYYKKKLMMRGLENATFSRRYDLNMIFRFNIHQFLLKADDPQQYYLHLDQETLDIKKIALPKVYHVNIIQKKTYIDHHGKKQQDLNKFRLIVDKNGIKRIEHIV